jgi:hypothetical protein
LNEFESLYRHGMKNHTTVEVCGKKKKTFFQAPKDRKMYKKHEGEFFHDRTIKKVSEGRSTKMIRAFNSGNSKKIEDVIRQNVRDIPSNKQMTMKIKTESGQWISSKVGNFDYVLEQFVDKMISRQNLYEAERLLPESLTIVEFESREHLKKSQLVRGGIKIYTMNKQYVILAPESDSNCFYHCLAFLTAIMKGDYERVHDNHKIVECSRDMKRAIGNDKDYSDMEDL